MIISIEGTDIMTFMIDKLGTVKYGYVEQLDGAYEAAIDHYGYDRPPEGKQVIINRVMRIMQSIIHNQG